MHTYQGQFEHVLYRIIRLWVATSGATATVYDLEDPAGAPILADIPAHHARTVTHILNECLYTITSTGIHAVQLDAYDPDDPNGRIGAPGMMCSPIAQPVALTVCRRINIRRAARFILSGLTSPEPESMAMNNAYEQVA